MIFVDSNIPMYLIGAPHPNKDRGRRLLEEAMMRHERLVTDVEVFQEILHRYSAIARREAIRPAFDVLAATVDEVFPVEMGDVVRARDIVLSVTGISARDAIHVAVMERRGVDQIMSFDEGFDRFSGLARLGAESHRK